MSSWRLPLGKRLRGVLRNRLHEVVKFQVERYASEKITDKTFALDHSLRRLTPPASPAKAIAVVSCLPPARTGIGSATLRTFQATSQAVDIFAPFDSSVDYISGLNQSSLTNDGVRIFDLQVFPFALRQNAYTALLFVLGNSVHNIPIVHALRRARFLSPKLPIFVHFHDPIVMHLARLVAGLDGAQLRDIIYQRNGVDYEELPNDEKLAEVGICGARAVLGDARIDRVIINSRRAEEILAQELAREKICRFFHPIFDIRGDDDRPHDNAKEKIRLGTFGIPSDRKRTEIVIAAFKQFKKTFPSATLVIAGYDAYSYASMHGLHRSEGFEVFDCGEEEFDGLMRSVDIAVQLRGVNWGESSGALARLLSLDIPIVVSRIGALSEHGDAVTYFDEQGNARDLTRLLISLATGKVTGDLERRRQLREQHSARRFCDLLTDLAERTAAAR